MNELISENPRVAFFDSGIGGLNLLAECVRRLPYANFTYFADNYNMPYGALGSNELLIKIDEIFETIAAYGPHVAVIACNTVTAVCAKQLRGKYSFPIVGVEPAIKPAAQKGGKCLVLSTPVTANSASISTLLKKYGNGITEVVACPNLAEYIERNIFNIEEREIIKLLPKCSPDRVVLGCTHYTYIKDIVKRFYDCEIYDGIYGAANRLCNILAPNCPNMAPSDSLIVFSGGDVSKNKAVFSTLFPNLNA